MIGPQRRPRGRPGEPERKERSAQLGGITRVVALTTAIAAVGVLVILQLTLFLLT